MKLARLLVYLGFAILGTECKIPWPYLLRTELARGHKGHIPPRQASLLSTRQVPRSAAPAKIKELGVPVVPNGRYELRAPGNISAVLRAVYSCDDGYYLEGPSEIFCEIANGTVLWTPDPPQCREIRDCNDIQFLENAYIYDVGEDNGQGNTYHDALECCKAGHKLRFSCYNDERYELIGTDTVMCLMNGSWSSPVPECKSRDCSHPGVPPNGGVSFFLGDTELWDDCCQSGTDAFYYCDHGYDLVGADVATCNNREWTAPRPRCRPPEACEDILVKHGTVDGRRQDEEYFLPWDTAFVSCDHGYRINGTDMLQCLEDGQWSDDPPTCVEYNCTKVDFGPHVLVHEFMDSNVTDFPVGSTVQVSCESGYMLRGASSITCRDGGWFGKKPECLRIHCGRLTAPEFGWVSGSSSLVGAIASFGCQQGFLLEGPEDRFCLANGQWSGAVPRCLSEVTLTKRNGCLSPGIPDNGIKSGSYYGFGARVNFSCNKSYHLRGNRTIVCQRNGQWSDALPVCIGPFYYDLPWDVQVTLQRPLSEMKEESDKINVAFTDDRARALNLNISGVRHVAYFLIDASASMGEKDFKKGVSLVKAIVKKIKVTEHGHRVGVLTFNNTVQVVVSPLHVRSTDVALEKLDSIKYYGGGTALSAALSAARTNFDTVKGLWSGGSKLYFSVFVISDGKANIGGNPKVLINDLKGKLYNADVYTIGVTSSPDKKMLDDLASLPLKEHVFILKDYDSMQWLAEILTNGTIDYSICGSTMRHNTDNGTEDESEERRARVMGGIKAQQPWPWMVAIFDRTRADQVMCGASIIARAWLLSAAHCFYTTEKPKMLRDKNDFLIKLGLTDTKNTSHMLEVQIEEIIIHDEYNNTTYENDIALLRLKKNITYQQYVRPICLPPAYEQLPGDSSFYKEQEFAFAIGWGLEKARGHGVNHLKQVKLQIQSQAVCRRELKDFTDTAMCVNGTKAGHDTCSGDSGGPLMQGIAADEYIWTQVGIVSWGENCGRKPSAYTNVAKYRGWMGRIMQKDRTAG